MPQEELRSGLAHIVEHLILKHVYNSARKSIRSTLNASYSEYNGMTTADFCFLYFSINDDTKILLDEILGDFSKNIWLDKDGFNQEKKIIINEIDTYLLNQYQAMQVLGLRYIFSESSPYFSFFGSKELIYNLSYEKTLSRIQDIFYNNKFLLVEKGSNHISHNLLNNRSNYIDDMSPRQKKIIVNSSAKSLYATKFFPISSCEDYILVRARYLEEKFEKLTKFQDTISHSYQIESQISLFYEGVMVTYFIEDDKIPSYTFEKFREQILHKNILSDPYKFIRIGNEFEAYNTNFSSLWHLYMLQKTYYPYTSASKQISEFSKEPFITEIEI